MRIAFVIHTYGTYALQTDILGIANFTRFLYVCINTYAFVSSPRNYIPEKCFHVLSCTTYMFWYTHTCNTICVCLSSSYIHIYIYICRHQSAAIPSLLVHISFFLPFCQLSSYICIHMYTYMSVYLRVIYTYQLKSAYFYSCQFIFYVCASLSSFVEIHLCLSTQFRQSKCTYFLAVAPTVSPFQVYMAAAAQQQMRRLRKKVEAVVVVVVVVV